MRRSSIVVVDPDVHFTSWIGSFLEAHGFRVMATLAETETGAAVVAAHRPDIALLPLYQSADQGRLGARCRQLSPKTRVLFYAPETDRSTIMAAHAANAAGVVRKSHVGDQLPEALLLVLSGGTYFPA